MEFLSFGCQKKTKTTQMDFTITVKKLNVVLVFFGCYNKVPEI